MGLVVKIKAVTFGTLFWTLAQTGYCAGIDTKLSTQDATSYHQSLNGAWQAMSEAQQQAYNWAVGNASLQQLAIKYPDLTPRNVIARETAEYIASKTQIIAELTAELATNADKLASEEATVREVREELAKLTVQDTGFQKVPDASRREELRFVYTVKNASRFNIASVKWDAWLRINGEETDGRYCQIVSDYKKDGGLLAGQFRDDFITLIGATEQCPRWNTLEVQHAQSRRVKMTLDEGSVADFGNNRILPHFSPVRADYESGIANAQKDLEVAQKMQASLTAPAQ